MVLTLVRHARRRRPPSTTAPLPAHPLAPPTITARLQEALDLRSRRVVDHPPSQLLERRLALPEELRRPLTPRAPMCHPRGLVATIAPFAHARRESAANGAVRGATGRGVVLAHAPHAGERDRRALLIVV